MAEYRIFGGKHLYGETRISGAKNSALPILAATLLTDEPCVLENCPDLSDVRATLEILQLLGHQFRRQGETVELFGCGQCRRIPEHLMREMRSSIIFLGAMIGRFGEAYLTMPGGCELGPRPIDLHLNALQKMGMQVVLKNGDLVCQAPGGLHGADISLAFPSVGATENIMLAAALADGITVVNNAAREPEIEDLAGFLQSCGAKIEGAGSSCVRICGVECLHGTHHQIMPDRIEAATMMAAAAMTRGKVLVYNVPLRGLTAIFPLFEESGCEIKLYDNDRLYIIGCERPRRMRSVITMPYPGFPTDAQAVMMSVAAIARGTSVFIENIFESRYKHTCELARMGARIQTEGRVAVVEGVAQLHGTTVEATDLRGGAALVLAGLAADGMTRLNGLHHIDRGYEHFEAKLQKLGAKIVRKESA